MRAINNCFNSPCSRHVTHSFNWRYLASNIDLMSDQYDSSAVGDSAFKCGGDLIQVLWRDGNLNQLKDDPFTSFTLSERRQHPRVILCCSQYFVTGFEIHSHQQNLE